MECFFGKWDSNDLYNVQRWFPTSYADLYLFIPCLYGWMYNRIITVSEYVHYALICVDDLFAKYFAFLVANLDFEHQKEVVGSSAKSKQCNKICKRRWSNMFQFQMCWFTWVSDDFNQEKHAQHGNLLGIYKFPTSLVLQQGPQVPASLHPLHAAFLATVWCIHGLDNLGKTMKNHLPTKAVSGFREVHPGKLTWQWKMDPLKMYFLLKMGIFHCYVSLPEGSSKPTVSIICSLTVSNILLPNPWK